MFFFFFSSRRRHTRLTCDWSSDVCSSDLVPCIVRWKGRIVAGATSDRVTGFEDWLPTLMELIGAQSVRPKGVDGISFAPTLLGLEQEPRPFIYREFPGYGGQQTLRAGDWKLVRQHLHPVNK